MGNPIKYTELVDKGDVEAGFAGLINLYKTLEKDAKKAITGIKEATRGIVPTSKGAATAVDQQSRAFKEQKGVVNESQKAIKALTSAQQKLRIANSNVGIETAKLRDSIQRQNRNTKQAITLSRSNKGSMVALNVELAKNRQRYRELSAAQRANANVGGKLLTTIKQQDTNLKKLDASIGNNQRSVGNYGIALQGATRLLGALGLAGGIALVVRGLKEMIGVFAGFEKQMAKVRAVSGATDEEFALLTEDAKRLGESTEKTALQVGELQLSYAKLGFTTPQIIAATEATLDLATATDEELAQSALVAAKTIKGFNLSAEETARVTDVMALSFSMSALNLSAFQDAMKTVAPVALAVNSSLESTTAVLSTLVDAGLDASTAGTSLRNIFIELAKQGISWEDAMEQVRNSTNKLKTATDLFGKRASTAALIIADNTEKIDSLTISYENAEGSAKAMADIMRDVLTGDVDRARSAVEGLAIQIGEKLTPFLRSAVQGFTSLIGSLSDLLGSSQKATDEFKKQAGIVTDLEENIIPLIDRYDELTEKTSLNKDEQEELDKLIIQLAEDVPLAVTEFDKYGKALGISTEAARAFIEEQKAILKIKNKEAIEEQKDAIIDLGDELGSFVLKLDKVNGKFVEQTTIFTKSGTAIKRVIDLTAEEVTARAARRREIEIEIKARTAIIAQLQGEETEAEKLIKTKGKVTGKEIEIITSLIKKQQELLKTAKELPETTERELAIKNKRIKIINTEITRLKKLGVEEDKNLTRLKELQKLLKKQKEALEEIVDETTEASEATILSAKIEIKSTQDKIEAIEKLLSLKEEEKKQREKEAEEIRKKAESEFAFQEDVLFGAKSLVEQENMLFDERLRMAGIFGIERENLTAHQLEVLEILEQEHQDNLLKIRKDEFKEVKELADIAVNGIIEGLNRRADAAIDTANTEIQATEKQISQQEALAAQGLDNSLKFEQEQRAKALLAKLEAEKSKQTAEKISAFWNLVSNSDNVLDAIAKFGIGEAFARTIEALPGLEGGGLTPEKESIVKVSEKGREFIAHHEATEKYLPQLKAMNEGTYDAQMTNYIDNSRFIPQNIPTNDIQIQQLTSEMQAMRQSFEKNLPKIETYFDTSTREVINIVKYHNRKKITHYKVPRV